MTKRMIVAALSLAGIFVALYLLLYKLGRIGTLSCSIGSCETVNASRWATFLGLPVAAWGVAFYVVLFGVALASTTEKYEDSARMSGLLLGMTALGVLFSAWLTYRASTAEHAGERGVTTAENDLNRSWDHQALWIVLFLCLNYDDR